MVEILDRAVIVPVLTEIESMDQPCMGAEITGLMSVAGADQELHALQSHRVSDAPSAETPGSTTTLLSPQQKFDRAYWALQAAFGAHGQAPGTRLNEAVRQLYNMERASMDGDVVFPEGETDMIIKMFAARGDLVRMRTPRAEYMLMGIVGVAYYNRLA